MGGDPLNERERQRDRACTWHPRCAPAASLALLLLAATPAVAEQPRGIDESFFAPGGALDNVLPAEAAMASRSAQSAFGAPAAGAAAPLVDAAPLAEAAPLMEATALPGAAAGMPAPASEAAPAEGASPAAEDGDATATPGIPFGPGDLAASGLRLFLGLAFVVALIYGLNALLRRTRGPLVAGESLVRRLASETIGPNQVVHILDVSGRILVVGVTDKGMTMLGDLDGEAADRARLAASRRSAVESGDGARASFGRALRNFTSGWTGERLEPGSSPAPGMAGIEPGDVRAAELAGASRSSARDGRAPRRDPAGVSPERERPGAERPGAERPSAERRRLDERLGASLARQREILRGLNL